MIHPPVPPEAWAAEGARSAAQLEHAAAAVVVGSDPQVAAIVAVALARRQPPERRVAIADLTGGIAELEPLTGLPTVESGLLDCFRDGTSLSAVARAVPGDPRLFVLSAGGAGVDSRAVLESPRWGKLVAGFRETGALLLLVARAHADGLPTLLAGTDGAVAVDLPPTMLRTWPLLATVDRPEAELPPLRPLPPLTAPRSRMKRLRAAFGSRVGRAVLGLSAIGALVTALVVGRDRLPWGGAAQPAPTVPAAADTTPPLEPAPADTITLGPVVNPEDSATAAAFTVELVAANTLAGANSRLEMRGASLPVPVLAPVPLGADGRPWYRACTGAWRTRQEATAFLASLRDRGLVRQESGRVLRAPYALRIADGVPVADVPAALARWTALGIPAYALLQDDGRARLYAGVFETSGQSLLLAVSLRDHGVAPVLAFRTGRAF